MIPAAFAKATVDREGAAGTAWLAALPSIVDDLLTRWKCERAGEVMHGEVGVVVPVRGAVLKVSFPHPGNVHEPDAFAAWDGRGAVHLYERDDTHYAMLLERTHPTTLANHRPASLAVDAGEMATIAGSLLRQLMIPAPDGLPRMSDQAPAWAESLRTDAAELDHALPATVVDEALAVVDELCRKQPQTLLHGDFHPRNILRADREPWLAVDPKGYVGDPAYDAAIFLRTRAYYLHVGDGLTGNDLLQRLHTELDHFAEAAGLDADRIRRWTQLIAVQSAFGVRRQGSHHRAHDNAQLARLLDLIDHLAVALTT
ncbi:aminoglycoside phosphotransferase family protein [Kribbella hippodromi]|uniref:Aminoglycoside phosphotransferase family protein n=1 Tax=Kribbella hippodromi TaxID=434347 RepID=A0ABP4NB97_9ACTN